MLGGFRAERGGRVVPDSAWQRRSARALIKLLAMTPGHRLHREQIEETLWPDLPGDSAASQFRKAVHFARHALEPDLAPRDPSTYLRVTDDLAALNADRCWIDADAFQAAATASLASGDIDAMNQARDLYPGELLPEDRYADWTLAPREALARQHRSLLLEMAAIYERRGARGAAANLLHEMLDQDPTQEEIHRRLMRLAIAEGRRHEAISQYQRCRAALKDELDAQPEPATEQLYHAIVAGRVASHPAAANVLPPAIRRQPATPLIGRDTVLDLLQQDLRRARDGEGRAILIGGEMGVGKTRLAGELARTAHRTGAIVLWGTAYEPEGRLPFGPIAEALDNYVIGQTDPVRARLRADHSALAALVPSLGPPVGGQPTAAADQRARLYAAIARFLTELARDQPLLLVVDDLHAADDATLQVFHHVARAAATRPWLIVGTYRDDAAGDHDLGQIATDINRRGLGQQLTLSRLARQDCDRLLTQMVPDGDLADPFLDEIFTRTLGNPLFAHEIMQALLDNGLLVRMDSEWMAPAASLIQVPDRLQSLVVGRIDRLGGDARRVLALAAVAGSDCTFTLLREASRMDDAALFTTLDLALTARVVEERGDGYAFVHPIFRAALNERLDRPRRSSLHTALAEALEARAAESGQASAELNEALAHHWTAAGEPGRAIPYLIEAADHAARVYATAEAIDRLHRALALTEAVAFPREQIAARRAAICERLGGLHALAGHAVLARDAFQQALATGALPPIATVRLQRQAARQALAAGAITDAEEHIAGAMKLLAGSPRGPAAGREQIQLQIVAAQAHFLANRFSAALAAAEESARLAKTAGTEADLAQALEMVSMACLPLGEWQRGLAIERQHAGVVDLNRFVRDMADVHFCFGDYHIYAPQPAATARTFELALTEAQRMEAPRSLALCHYYLGVMAYFRGRFHDAITRETEAIGFYQRVDSRFGEAMARLIRGVSQTALGRLDAGRKDMERGLAIASEGTLHTHAMLRLYAGLCRNRFDANDGRAAQAYAEAGLTLTDEPSTCICYASFLPGATVAAAVTGNLDQAARLGGSALATARRFGSPAFACMAQQANAVVFALTGSWQPALAALDEAGELARRHDFPYELARVLLLRSFVHMERRRRGDLPAAAGLMTEASSRLVRLGVRASAAQLRSSVGFLREHAARPH